MSKFSVVFVATGVLAIFLLGMALGVFLPLRGKPGGPVIANTPALLQQVQGLSQLVSVKYVLEKLIILEDVKWYGENRVTLVAHGVVKAGVNLALLKPGDLEIQGTRVVVHLPAPGITDVYLEDHRTQVLERSTGLLRLFDKDLEQNARRQAVDELRTAALHGEILRDAAQRTREQVTNLLQQLGFQSVVFQSDVPVR
jgi:hypothetical protein